MHTEKEAREPKLDIDVDAIDVEKVASVTLKRLITEVRNEKASGVAGIYDRVHVRHNR
jgi:hypothetical protein